MVLITGYRGLAETLIAEFLQSNALTSALVRDEKAIGALRDKFPGGHFFSGDAVNGSDCKRWIDCVMGEFGRIDCLVNNAAVTGPGGKTHDISFIDFRLTLDINFLAPVRLIKFVLPVFLKQGSGVVINLSGGGATQGRPNFGAYASSKCALVRFTETIAQEYPELQFYAMSPGGLMTPMIEKMLAMDPHAIGAEYTEAKRRLEHGGEDPLKAARLARWLLEHRPTKLSGTLISAVWDDYEHTDQLSQNGDWWRLRRVDTVLQEKLGAYQERT